MLGAAIVPGSRKYESKLIEFFQDCRGVKINMLNMMIEKINSTPSYLNIEQHPFNNIKDSEGLIFSEQKTNTI